MILYNMLNVKLSNSQLSKFKSAIKYGTGVTLNTSSNIIGDSNNENNCPHNLLLTKTQVSRLRKAFPNKSASLARIPIGISSSSIGLKFCVINAAIKNYKSKCKKKGRSMIK